MTDIVKLNKALIERNTHATTKRGRLEYISDLFSSKSHAACAVPSTALRLRYE